MEVALRAAQFARFVLLFDVYFCVLFTLLVLFVLYGFCLGVFCRSVYWYSKK